MVVENRVDGSKAILLLIEAAKRGHEEVVKLLLEHEADVNAIFHNLNPLVVAASAYGDHVAMIQLLLDRGADVNTSLSGGPGSALIAAAF